MALKVGIVGMGYVGLTLTAALAKAGHTVYGVDAKQSVIDCLSRGEPHIFEPGLEEVFKELVGSTIFVGDRLPTGLDAAILCVSTPVDLSTGKPNLSYLTSAAHDIASWCGPETLVVVRSTVPIGTTRNIVLPALRQNWDSPKLVMAPERTIQGQALDELVNLPQVVGGLDDASLAAGIEVFGQLATQIVPVSSLEAAEMVKLSNNCHTDLIYAFGNELALIAGQHGLDPLEVIRAANLDYPRPDLAKPGYVGGGCLTKDPYIMLNSVEGSAQQPYLIPQARKLNEDLPELVAREVVELMRQHCGSTYGTTLTVLGWAYKGVPATDDMRGTPIETMMPVFREAGITVRGHDPVVTDAVIDAYGGQPLGLDEALVGTDGVLVINDHPDYRAIRPESVWAGAGRPRFVFDSWRILDQEAVKAAGIDYAGLGYRAKPGVPA